LFRLAHISDPHLTAVPRLGLTDILSKRLFGFYNWHRNRRRAFGPATLKALVADIHAAKPDHIAVTGDLVNVGLHAEFVGAHEWLKEVGPPDHVTLIPGNHDVYMPGSFEELAREWGSYMTADGAPEGRITFPFVRRRGPVALVGVSSAVPTPPLFATGWIGPAQAAALAETLAALSAERLFRVVLVHHSPVSGATGWYRRLVDAQRFREAVYSGGAELVLHGHNHRTHVDAIPGPTGPVPVVGVAAASVLPIEDARGGSYCLFEIETDGGFSCRMTERGMPRTDGKVETLRDEALVIGSASKSVSA
jgi:3',5'-cyclic AMP phosphodiesterase CpdA